MILFFIVGVALIAMIPLGFMYAEVKSGHAQGRNYRAVATLGMAICVLTIVLAILISLLNAMIR